MKNKKNKKTVLVCTVMNYSPSQSLENLGFGASCGVTKSAKCSSVTCEKLSRKVNGDTLC